MNGGTAAPDNPADIDRLISDGIEYLLQTVQPGDQRHRWPTGKSGAATDPCDLQHGAAGVLGFLVRAHQNRPEARLWEAIADTASWIEEHLEQGQRVLPGLCFGRSGTAWSLLDAGQALGDEHLVAAAEKLALQVPLSWPNPDVCHGVAGAGLTQLRFWEVSGHADFRQRAGAAAEAVAAAAEWQERRLRWPIPRDFASDVAGLSHLGFAHGMAGCASFLLAADRAAVEFRYHDLVILAAQTLLDAAQVVEGAAYWPSDEDSTTGKTHWCSGSSGIGTFLIRAWQEYGDDRWLQAAHQAALAVRRSRWHAGPSQCHGLAGDGEFLLDLADSTDQDCYLEWAWELVPAIQVRHAIRQGTGLSGVLAFLLRLRDGGPRMWLPENFTRPPAR
jgi:lantibiotic modifying enzyme